MQIYKTPSEVIVTKIIPVRWNKVNKKLKNCPHVHAMLNEDVI